MVDEGWPIGRAGRTARPREKRAKVLLTCEIVGEKGRTVGHVRDLSPDGCRIHTSQRYDVREVVVVALRTPSAELVDFAAEIRWAADGPGRDVVGMGCRFIHTARSRREAQAIIDEATSHPHPPRAPRPIGGPQLASP